MGLEFDESVAASNQGLKDEKGQNTILSISPAPNSGSRGVVLQGESRQVARKAPVPFLRVIERTSIEYESRRVLKPQSPYVWKI